MLVVCVVGCKVFYRAESYFIERNQFIYRNDKANIDLSTYSPIISDSGEWYKKYHIISHGGGEIGGKCNTNSAEEWEKSYLKGNRIFDADLAFTGDHILVLRHEWSDDLGQDNISEDRIPDYEEFMNTPIHSLYTPMSCYDMITFMNKYDDCYVACDFKDGEADTFEFLVNAAWQMNCVDILDRIIVSFYSYEQYREIKAVFKFKNWAIRQYENEPHNYYELAEFCLKNRIPVVMIKAAYLDAGDDISVLTENGITVFNAVINNLEEYREYEKQGVSGCVSDFISEKDLK